MKKTIIFLLFIFIISHIFAKPNFNKIIPDNIVDISIEGGGGVYLGDFLNHLQRDGAYIATPTLDLYISLFIIKYFGVQALIGTGTVIHPNSTPIEGTILYMGLELFGQYDWKYAFIKFFAGAGFEHTTMLLQWYASGFFEGGTGFGIKITDWMYINTSVKYRVGFLHSVIIFLKYNLPTSDTLMSITFSMGLVFRIKNPSKYRYSKQD